MLCLFSCKTVLSGISTKSKPSNEYSYVYGFFSASWGAVATLSPPDMYLVLADSNQKKYFIKFEPDYKALKVLRLPAGQYHVSNVAFKNDLRWTIKNLPLLQKANHLTNNFEAHQNTATYLGDWEGSISSQIDSVDIVTTTSLNQVNDRFEETTRRIVNVNPFFNGYIFRKIK